MLKGAYSSPKIHSLSAKLKIPFSQAVGVCGLLWNFTSDHAPRGDVGKYDDGAIAAACYWTQDAQELVSALVECKLLDRDNEYRLLVHDWSEHSPSYVKKKLSSKGLTFAERSASAPSLKLSQSDCKTIARRLPLDCNSIAIPPQSDCEGGGEGEGEGKGKGKGKPRGGAGEITWSPDAGWIGITPKDRERWSVAYPACDLDRQLAAMGEWLMANPRRATKTNWRQFVTGWLGREQNRGGDVRSGVTTNHTHQPTPDPLAEFGDAIVPKGRRGFFTRTNP